MKTALVTGASSGIGKAIAVGLRAAGFGVLALGRNMNALAQLKTECGCETLAVDVNDRPSLKAALADRHFDVLANNAGLLPPLRSFPDAAQQDIDATIATNLTSVLYLTRLVSPGMCARKSGHIFFTGSTAGHTPFPNFAAYCATKAGIAGFAQALRLDLAPHGVRVTEIVAGRVETALYRNIVSDETRQAMYANHSAVQPEDVAAMVLSVLNMPSHVDVSRFDIVPTNQSTTTGSNKG
jgi:3-hydroxy acid dehydrogenase / malonic semialdehyde reductase